MDKTDFSTFQILIAEDNAENFDFLRYSLKKTGITIHHAKNGQEAIDIFRSQPKIDLVLMDAMMPVIDGFEASRQIKKIRAEVPLVMLTAYVSPMSIKRAVASGCNDYIAKPLSVENLFAALEKWLILTPPKKP